MIEDLQQAFPNATDEHRKVTHAVNYVIQRVPGFNTDDDLYKFTAALAIAGSTRNDGVPATPPRRPRA